jgi:hypothetical protein
MARSFAATTSRTSAPTVNSEGSIRSRSRSSSRFASALRRSRSRCALRETTSSSGPDSSRPRGSFRLRDRPESARRGHPDRHGGVGAVVARDRPRARVGDDARRIPARLDVQRLLRGGAPRAARAFSMSDGRIQPSRIPANTSRPTAITNAMPRARQDKAVTEASYQPSAISYRL